MQPIPFTLTNDSITVIVDGQPKVVRRSAGAQYVSLREALFNEKWDDALALTKSPAPALATYLSEAGLGAFTLDGTTLKLGDREVPANITRRIDTMLTRGESPAPLLRFFDRLQKNPSWRSVGQLFPFMEKENIPIEADGTFLTYKGVNQNLTDKHTGTVDNTPGVVNTMERNLVSDDPNQTCHYGYHVCSIKYLSYFGADRVVICRVDPADVVCVPADHSAQKMRVCKYEVVGFYTGQPLPSTSVTKQDVIDDEDLDNEPDYSDDVDPDNEFDVSAGERESTYNGDGDNYIDGDAPAPYVANDVMPDPPSTPIELDRHEETLVEEGNIIGAIKAIRDRLPGTGLREAKDAVDLVRGQVGRPASYTGSTPVARLIPVAAEATTAPRKGRSAPADTEKLAKLLPRELLEQTIDSLRAYAAKLKIVGASKLPGGKVALVKQISKARRK